MSNGAHAASSRAYSASRGALMRGSAAPSDAGFMGLLFDDSLDADGAPEAAQISHSQIIERQAETITRLEASAARAKEYKTLTKVKLKEAAQRLKEYRLRVESLLGEVEASKSDVSKLEAEKKKALAQVQMLKKKADAKAPTMRKSATKTVAVQTETKSVRTMEVQTMESEKRTREMQTQTEAEAGESPQPSQAKRIPQKPPPARGRATAVEKASEKVVAASQKPVVKSTPLVLTKAKATHKTTEKVVEKSAATAAVATTSVFDAISATIDAELDFSDDGDEEEEQDKLPSATTTTAPQASAMTAVASATGACVMSPVLLSELQDDAISREIDAELDFGSSSDDSSSSSSDDDDDDEDDTKTELQKHNEEVGVAVAVAVAVAVSKESSGEMGVAFPGAEGLSTAKIGLGGGDVDAITAAIDAELASSSDDEGHGDEDIVLGDLLANTTDPLLQSPRQDQAASVRVGLPMDPSLAAINAPASSTEKSAVEHPASSADVEMTLMTMPATISGPVDDISAALDAELATSSSEDEHEHAQSADPPATQATNVPNVAVEPLRNDVEMAEPTEPDASAVNPVVQKIHRIQQKAPESSREVHQVKQISIPAADEIKDNTGNCEDIDNSPVAALEEVLREKSRALSLSSDSGSDSDSSTSSSSASENGDTVGPGINPVVAHTQSESSARRPSDSIQGADKPTSVPVESIWAASIAKEEFSTATLGSSPAKALPVRNKRESVASNPVEEPDLKKQKTLSPVAPKKPAIPARVLPDTASTQPDHNGLSIDNGPRVEKPVPVKQPLGQQSALPPRVWASYKISVAPQEGENVDVQYVTRTLGLLLKQVSSFLTRSANGIGFKRDFYAQVTTHADVLKLCKMLADEYHHRQVACAVLVDAMTRVLRTPRTRQLVDRSLVVVSVLFRNVLFRRLRLDSEQANTNGMVSELHACLVHLRNQVVGGRLDKGLALPRGGGTDPESIASVASASGPASSTKASAIGHEIAFLAHVCAFHAAICQTIDRSDVARVLLVDVLKCHPNIKGLYCIHAMAQVDPVILRKQWDVHGRERRSALRSVIIHLLLVIAAQSREKQETVLFKETAATLLSVVADAIDEPQLEPVGYSYGRGFGGPSNESIHEFQATLWRDHIVPCVVEAIDDTDLFDTASALELLGSFHGDAMMGRHFSLFKFQNLLTTEDRTDHEDGAVDAESSGKPRRPDALKCMKVVRLVGSLCRGVLRSHSTDHAENDGDGETPPLREVVVAELTEILLGMSTQSLDHSKVAKRRDATLYSLLKWLTPSRLAALPASSLRQLRLLVVAARPLTETISSNR